MTTTNWNIRFSEEHHHTLVLEISEGEKLLAHTELTAQGVEALVNILTNMRTKMIPPVPLEIPTQPHAAGPANPVYAVLDVPVVPGKLLMLRHEGFGWMSFLIPQAEADKMAYGLLEQPALAAPGTRTVN